MSTTLHPARHPHGGPNVQHSAARRHRRAAPLAGALALAAAALLAGCGGGGGGGASGDPHTASVIITTPPANQAVVSGQSARFSVVATGNGSLNYQWRLNGTDVSGATASTLDLTALDVSRDNAQVTVRIADNNGSKVSDPATLRVYSAANVPAPQTLNIPANANEAGIDTSFGAHSATTNSAVSAKGRLFVFLPASLSVPSRTQLVMNAAAANGFHALGLAYPNDVVLDSICSGSNDGACWANAREEIRNGSAVSANVSVNATNGIENRLLRALQYLVQAQPTGGWEQFLDNGAVRWDRVRLSGHSQGGGHAAYIASKHAVERACLFSSPADYDDVRQQPAAWLSAGSATAAGQIYAFAHQRDQVIGFNRLQTIWSAMGLAGFGATALVDGAALSAYQGRHTLSTNLQAGSNLPTASYHGMPVVDSLTPIDSGSGLPTYWPVWQYACFL